MPQSNFQGNSQARTLAGLPGARRTSGTLPPESVSAGCYGIFVSRGEGARQRTGMVEIYSMARRRSSHIGGLPARLPAHGGDHCGSEPETEISVDLKAAQGFGDALPAVRAFQRGAPGWSAPAGKPGWSVPAGKLLWRGLDELAHRGERPGACHARGRGGLHVDIDPESVAQHPEREPGLGAERGQDVPLGAGVGAGPVSAHPAVARDGAVPSHAVGHSGGEQVRGPRRTPWRGIHMRAQDWTRLASLRRKYIRHEQIPSPLVGHSWGSRPAPHITPTSGPFPGDIANWACVPGPQAGDIGRGPGTRAHSPGRTPPNSRGKGAPTRCVVGWVESGYVKRDANDTRHLSSCLVTSARPSGLMCGGSDGR